MKNPLEALDLKHLAKQRKLKEQSGYFSAQDLNSTSKEQEDHALSRNNSGKSNHNTLVSIFQSLKHPNNSNLQIGVSHMRHFLQH